MKKYKGVTLIELIIAISLLSLIILSGSGIYLTGWNMLRDAQVITQAQNNAIVPMTHMVKNLRQAAKITGIGAETPYSEIEFIVITDITTDPPTTVTRRYKFTAGEIRYFPIYVEDLSPYNVIGKHIMGCNFSGNLDESVTIKIDAYDNNDDVNYMLKTDIEAPYTSIPTTY